MPTDPTNKQPMTHADRQLFHEMIGRIRVLEKVATYHFLEGRIDRQKLSNELHGHMVSFYLGPVLGGDCGDMCPDGEGGCIECDGPQKIQ